jgi:hypothetical protein
MDADDVSLPGRLERQVSYLNAHPEIAAVGAWVRRLDENGELGALQRYPTSPALIAWSLFFFNALAHPSVMMRRTVVNMEALYDPLYRLAQDYALFTSLSRGVPLANIPEVLLHYRTWSGNSSREPAQELIGIQIARQHVAAFGISATEEQIRHLHGLARDRYPSQPAELAALAAFILELRAALPDFSCAADARSVDVDTAVRLWQLAIQATQVAPRLSLSLARRAFALSPRSVLDVARKATRRLRRPR